MSPGPPPTPSSLSFCAGFQISRDPIQALNDRYKKIWGCEQPSNRTTLFLWVGSARSFITEKNNILQKSDRVVAAVGDGMQTAKDFIGPQEMTKVLGRAVKMMLI